MAHFKGDGPEMQPVKVTISEVTCEGTVSLGKYIFVTG